MLKSMLSSLCALLLCVGVAAQSQAANFTIGGTISRLAGTGLVLQNNGGNDLAVSQNGTFVFSTPLPTGASYSVTVKTPPSYPAQVCETKNGSGKVGTTNVSVT